MATNNNDSNQITLHDNIANDEQDDNLNLTEEMHIKLRSHRNSQTSSNLKSREERILSQKMSQLSINAAYEKEFIMKTIEDILKKIPVYLTKRYEPFQQVLKEASTMIGIEATNSHRNKLRHIAILQYKIIMIQNYRHLWSTYLKSGLGQLIVADSEKNFIYPTNLQVWPQEIKSILPIIKTEEKNKHNIYMIFVNYQIHSLDDQLKQYQNELNIKIHQFKNNSFKIQPILEKYIRQHLSSECTKIKHQIELIHYDYHIQAIKQEYDRYNPNEYQRKLIRQLCQSKYEQEITQQEFDFLQKQINHYNSPSQSFENSPLSQSILINSIENTELRQQLHNQYKEIAEQSKGQLLALYMKIAEEQRDEYKKKHDNNIMKMWSEREESSDNEKIPLFMIDLIDERCKKIGERIQSMYKFKV